MIAAALSYHFVARHGYAIERLKRDMAAEPSSGCLVQFLAYEAANFVYGFLLATGNNVSPEDRRVRDELRDAIIQVLSGHGIDDASFVVSPEIETEGTSG